MTTERRVDPNDKKLYTKEEFRSFYSGEAEWDAAEVERRVDPADGKKYTMQEFTSHYGGTAKWEKAAEEHRIDPHDGKAYTKEEFVACYRALDEWDAVTPVGQATAGTPPVTPTFVEPEKRKAKDGNVYTQEEFKKYFGDSDGLAKWDASAATATQATAGTPPPVPPPTPDPTTTIEPEKRKAKDGNMYTQEEFKEYYNALEGPRMWDAATTTTSTPATTSALRTATLGQGGKTATLLDWTTPTSPTRSKSVPPEAAPEGRGTNSGATYLGSIYGAISGATNWAWGSKKSDDDWSSARRTRSERHGKKLPPAQVAERSYGGSGSGCDSDSSDSDSDEKPETEGKKGLSQEEMASKLPSDKRAIHKRASAKEGRNKKMKFYYRAYTAEEALLWEVRAALAGPCLRFSPEKAVLPTCDGEWKCKTLVGALGDVKSAGAGISALPTKVTELLNKAGLGQYAPHVLRSAQSRNVAAAGVLQVGVTHDVAADIEVDRDAETMVLRPKVVGVLQKRKVWLSPFPLATSCDRANFHQDLQSTLLSTLHPHASNTYPPASGGATPLRNFHQDLQPTLLSALHPRGGAASRASFLRHGWGASTPLRNATQAVLGDVPKWWDESKCTASNQ